MDALGMFIATLHQLVGHDKTAAFLHQSPGDPRFCLLCRYDRGRATRAEVEKWGHQ